MLKNKSYVKILTLLVVIVFLGTLTTIGSYAIVTGRNVEMGPKAVAVGMRSITGNYLVTLPCYPPDGRYNPSEPRLPEARGLPFNYNYYNPCDGHQILRNPFILDLAFWSAIYGTAYIFTDLGIGKL